ncbi:DNA repair-scaffolding protein isoform X3 [Microcebus murinus]|uniref:DNA repair-scaffolding protein isoform X3 n=1 Tax=Microcebus murinus TaxID=30608 RepID=UPI003F6ABE5E
MASGGGARGSKRKRNWDAEYPSFPGDRPLQVRRAGLRTAGAAASLSEAWLRCGEGFQDTSGTPSLTAEKKTVTEKHLELSPRPKKDELQFIDWEIDSDREDGSDRNECEDGEGAVDISDCASCASSHSSTSDERLPELPKPISTEILEYSSDSEKDDDSENTLVIDSESPHKLTESGSDARQGVERLTDPRAESAEIVIYTPQKWTATFPRTPENSAKKKKLLRGGLAERLNGLQNRERSAISLWRHRCVSYQKTLSGRKSGVLTVRILELHEECAMHVALCEQLAGPSAAGPSGSVGPRPGAHLKVLFTKETAGYLRGRPQNIVHIFPPWQKLTLPDGSCSVILNTYFCQKIVAKEDSETTRQVYCQDTPLPRRNIILAHMFRIKSLTNKSPEIQAVCAGAAATGTGWTRGCEEEAARGRAAVRDALLDVAEGAGAAPGVRVVVQRAYALPGGARAGARAARICLLVQDACGMFGEVHLEAAILKGRQLEGKSCSLVGMKVLQKATRGRAAGLFSLIDSLWPPVTPLKAPGHGQPCEEVKTHLPLPAFCYILTAHPVLGQIDILEEDPISKLYQPPVTRCLREILQTGDLGARCSFYARVIYQRPQLKNLLLLEQREIWLLVTDTTLQARAESDPELPRTLPVCVSPSCVLGPEVLEAFARAAPHDILFRDAVRDQGRVACVERTVLVPQKPLPRVAPGARPWAPTGPVTLDRLDPGTPANAACSVQGTVVGVDESTAFSWPACDQCGSGRLEQRPEDRAAFSCGDCSRAVTSPVVKRHLQVFLDCPSRPQCSVKVKLLQRSIASLLRFAACEDGSYEVERVLGKEVGPLNCFVRSVTAHPTRCVGLEEIALPEREAPARDAALPWDLRATRGKGGSSDGAVTC